MEWYKDYKLIKDGDTYTLEIFLNKESEEFGEEFLSNTKEKLLLLDEKIRNLLTDKFSDFNINTVKLMVGTLLVATIPLTSAAKVQAAEPIPVSVEQSVVQSAETTLNTTGTVTASNLNVRSGPSTGYPIIHALYQGNTVKVTGQSGDWYQIKLSNGATGWVSKQFLQVAGNQNPSDFTALNTSGTVTANKLNMRSGPSTGYSILHVLWRGNTVKVIGQSGDWYKIQLSDGRQGWVSKQYLNINSQTDTRQQKVDKVINTAKSFLGTPYVWGGESPSEGGFDCSGFTQYVFKQAGYSLNRISSDQARQGVAVSRANLQPGDLVFSSLNADGNISHVGIYLGNGQMIHSPKTGDVVKITDITTSYWTSRFVTARRIIQ